jgi:hypothetical protein
LRLSSSRSKASNPDNPEADFWPGAGTQGKVLGVLQGVPETDLVSAGPDFSLDDLQQLERVTKALAKASFMKPS